MSAVQGDETAVDPFTLAVAEELRVQLVRKQVSGRELARQLHVSSQWISQRTRGVVPMDTKDMNAICEVLSIELHELLSGAIQRVDGNRPTGLPTRQYDSAVGATLITFPQDRQSRRPYRDSVFGNGSSGSYVAQPSPSRVDQYGKRGNCADSA